MRIRDIIPAALAVLIGAAVFSNTSRAAAQTASPTPQLRGTIVRPTPGAAGAGAVTNNAGTSTTRGGRRGGRRGGPAPTPSGPMHPPVLPGKGMAEHDFMFAGGPDDGPIQTLWVVRGGKVVWSFDRPSRDPDNRQPEIDDATMLSNGDIVYADATSAVRVTPEKKVTWRYLTGFNAQIHSIQPLDLYRVLIMVNGNPAKAMIIDTKTSKTLKSFEVPVQRPGDNRSVHTQFRHIRMTAAGTILIPHLDTGKVSEYTQDGKEIWSYQSRSPWAAVRLKNGNTMISGDAGKWVREVDKDGKIVWELTQADIPDYRIANIQECDRLDNGNTIICNWGAGFPVVDRPGSVQILELTPDKKVVWALSQWSNPNLGPASTIQLLDQKGAAEKGDFQR